VVAVAILCCGCGAFAEETTNGAQAEHVLLFSGFDLWRGGGFIHGGALWSPQGLDASGFTFKLLLGGGSYRYRSGDIGIRGQELMASALPGWRFKGDRFELTIFGGIDMQSHRLLPDDPGNRLRGDRGGVRTGADLWYEPAPSLMATASISASSIGSSVWSRAAAGWRMPGVGWIGPEVSGFTDGHYREVRAGGHVTAFTTGPLEWSFGAGYARNSDRRAGAYGHIGILTRH
jgi:hypothetical protein